jgi:superoxide oxidase
MSPLPDPPHASAEDLGKPRPPFDGTTILLHWSTVVLVLLLLGTGLLRSDHGLYTARLLRIHRSLGVTVWVVTVLRLLWRLSGARLPDFPPTMTRAHTVVVRLSEYALYALLLLQPATGLAQTLWRGRPFELFAWSMPPLVAKNLDRMLLFHKIHEVGAWCLIGLIGLHALAALFHHFVRRDEILQAMIPALRRRAPSAAPH